MTIRPGGGSLLASDCEALVNTVNTVGVMGKGIALQFKQAFPDNYKAYRKACERGDVVPGKMFVFETGRLRPRLIINFPTKRHWRQPSRMDDVRSGLSDLVHVIAERKVRSIAVPPLGAGNGGLDWTAVRPMIEEALGHLPDLDVVLFEPGHAPPADLMAVAKLPTRMTEHRAVMLVTFERYLRGAFALGRLEAQKLVYFLQRAGQPFPRVEFVKGDYGPYAETVNHVLQTLDGRMIRGYGDRVMKSDIVVLPQALEQALAVLGDHEGVSGRVERVLRLVDGYEGLYGMELLATVDWAARHDLTAAASPEAASAAVQSWSRRKKKRFQPEHVSEAWRHLEAQGWLAGGRHASPLN